MEAAVPSPARVGRTPDVAVLGAGVVGLTTALVASRRGARVAVLERAGDHRGGAGWMSGGMLAPDCEVDGSSSRVIELARRSMRTASSLYDGLRLDGTIVLAPPRDPGQLARFARATPNHRTLDPAGLAALEPALAGRFAAALHYPGEGHLDPRRALEALVARIREAGGTVTFGWRGDPAEVDAGGVVDARGLGARDVFPDLRGVKGEMALVRSRHVVLTRPVRLLHHRHPLYVVPRAGGVYMIGATTVESDEAPVVSLRSAGELLTQAYAVDPAFADAEVLEFAAGLRPAFPDNDPRLVRHGRTVRVNGLYRHGWLVAPALAEDAIARLTEHRDLGVSA